MIHKISGDLNISVNTLGAELTSIQTPDGHEYLWQGSEDSWKGQSPVLFPIIGGIADGKYSLDGREYEMKQHGFARKREWKLIESRTGRLIFELTSDDETRGQYPFNFRFLLSYILKGSELIIAYDIQNTGGDEMVFAVGGHPGFVCPLEDNLDFNDYRLRFNRPENTVRYIKEGPLLTGKVEPFELPSGILPLNHELFKHGAVILREFDSTSIVLERGTGGKSGGRTVKVDFAGFPDLGIWSFPERPAPFICIEPWFGVDSTAGSESDKNMRTKSGIVTLPAGQKFECMFSITIGPDRGFL